MKENLLPPHRKSFCARQPDIFAPQILHHNQRRKILCDVITPPSSFCFSWILNWQNTIPAILKGKRDISLTKQWDRSDIRRNEPAHWSNILSLTKRHKTWERCKFHENEGVYFSDGPNWRVAIGPSSLRPTDNKLLFLLRWGWLIRQLIKVIDASISIKKLVRADLLKSSPVQRKQRVGWWKIGWGIYCRSAPPKKWGPVAPSVAPPGNGSLCPTMVNTEPLAPRILISGLSNVIIDPQKNTGTKLLDPTSKWVHITVVHCCTMSLSVIWVPRQMIITETQIAMTEIV